VATVSGTVGWEALHMGKKVVVFGDIYYQGLPGVFKYHDRLELKTVLEYRVEQSKLTDAISRFIARLEDGCLNGNLGPECDSQTNGMRVAEFLKRFIPQAAQRSAA
jgi:hypothetical protein